MNNERRTGLIIGLFAAALIVTSIIFSCKKDGATKAVITVIDRNNAAVSGATVTLWQDTAVNNTNGVKSNLRVSKTSDASGHAEFDFQLEAFLNIEAIKGQDTGRSFIRLKEHETVEQTVNL
jgi:hypothetical protein